jgi:hypothetical protein
VLLALGPGLMDAKRCSLRFIFVFCLTLICASPIHAAAPTKSPKSPPVSLNIRTAGELADACTAASTSQASFARLRWLANMGRAASKLRSRCSTTQIRGSG